MIDGCLLFWPWLVALVCSAHFCCVHCMSMFVEHAESYTHVLVKAEYSEFKKHLAIGLQKRPPKSDGLKQGMTKSGELETYIVSTNSC